MKFWGQGATPLPRIFDVASKQYGVLYLRNERNDMNESNFT